MAKSKAEQALIDSAVQVLDTIIATENEVGVFGRGRETVTKIGPKLPASCESTLLVSRIVELMGRGAAITPHSAEAEPLRHAAAAAIDQAVDDGKLVQASLHPQTKPGQKDIRYILAAQKEAWVTKMGREYEGQAEKWVASIAKNPVRLSSRTTMT